MLKQHGIINKEAVATVGACFRMITPAKSNYGPPPTDEPLIQWLKPSLRAHVLGSRWTWAGHPLATKHGKGTSSSLTHL